MVRTKNRIFAEKMLKWYEVNRRVFPWRYTFDPYLVFISEILLQQTNVEKVVEPYCRIVNEYNSFYELANADHIVLFNTIKPLGLFYRAERLIYVSKEIIERHQGLLPKSREELLKLTGIGDYICNTILCFGHGLPFGIVDTNVVRILQRYFGIISGKERPRTDKALWNFANMILPKESYIDYNYALIDFTSAVCTYRKPSCHICPIAEDCMTKTAN